MTRKLISVIIPFYNRTALLLDALASVRAQTYENWEVILVNDGSTEDIQKIRGLVDIEPRFHLIDQKKAGVSTARNVGIAHATGDYIAFLDSDDLWAPEKLELQVQYMGEHSYRASHTSYIRFDPTGKREMVNSGALQGWLLPGLLTDCPVNTSSFMAERELLCELPGPFCTQFHYGEDTCLYLSIASKCQIGGLKEPLVFTRIGETTAALDLNKIQQATANILSYVKSNPHLSCYQREIAALEDTLFEMERWQNQPGRKSGKVARLIFLTRKTVRYVKINGIKMALRRVIGYLRGDHGIWTSPKS